MRVLGVVLIVAALISCTTIGNKFDPDKVDQLTPGVSTLADAKTLLGPPTAETYREDGTKLVQWQYSQGSVLGGSGGHVAILFDQNDTMIRVTHRFKI